MHFGVRETTAAFAIAAVIFCCSCEKHRLGEDPEVQKEQVDESKSGEEKPAAQKRENSENAAPKRTPAQFFPESKPSP